jgi:hypothetical protein
MDATTKTWETHVREALDGVGDARGAGGGLASTLLRAQLARGFEGAHERALADARQLAETAARLVRRLEAEGLAATTGGIAFLSEAQSARESILAFEHAREAFRAVLHAHQTETGKGR